MTWTAVIARWQTLATRNYPPTHKENDMADTTTNPALDRQAKALDEIRQMQQDLIAAHKSNDELTKQLERAEDRLAMLVDERNRIKRDATIYQSKLIELATSMANIGLLTVKAQEIMATVRELTAQHGDTPEQQQHEHDTAAAVVAGLANIGNQANIGS